jgi:very-short-patch-repair endonuclease
MRTLARPDAAKPKGLRKRAAPSKKAQARALRSAPTLSETILWERLRKRRCLGYRFRRQSIILGWIVDFWCPKIRLVVEVDGSSHASRQSYDARRDRVMSNAAISVLRVPASVVVKTPGRAVWQIEDTIRTINREFNRAI